MIHMSVDVHQAPKMYYENDHAAMAVASSRKELMAWWSSVKNLKPFDQLVADRIDEAPHKMRLRVGLGYQNEGRTITKIFKEAFIKDITLN